MGLNMDSDCLAPRLATVMPTVPTPFRDDGVDFSAFNTFCNHLILQGVGGLVVAGTSGEGSALDERDYHDLVAEAVRTADSFVPVVAGVSGATTAAVIVRARSAERAGADAILAAPPRCVLPSPAGVCAHVTALHNAVGIPIVLRDPPSRTGVSLSVDVIGELAQLPRVIGVQDASGDLARPVRIRAAAGLEFVQLSGDDATFVAHLAQGGVGCVSVTANLAPATCVALLAAWHRGDRAEIARLRDILDPLHAALLARGSPIPVREALEQLGNLSAQPRLRASRRVGDLVTDTLGRLMPIEQAFASARARPPHCACHVIVPAPSQPTLLEAFSS